jgi:NTE family protein
MNPIDIGIALIQGRRSLLRNEPLFELVQEHFHCRELIKDFRFGVVAFEESIYWSYRGDDFTTDRSFQDAMLASTAQPVIWPPVFDILTTRSGWLHGLYDGGVMNVSPIADVLDENPDEIVIINCSNTQHERTPKRGTFDSIPKIAMRTFDLMLADNFRGDINTTLRLNNLVSQAEDAGITLKKADGSPYKAYRVRLIEPEIDLGDSFDFSQGAIQRRLEIGRTQVI